MLYLDDADINLSADMTRIGFEQTVIGMIAFLGGVMLVRYFFVESSITCAGQGSPKFSRQELDFAGSLARYYLWTAGVVYFGLGKLISAAIPSANSIMSSVGSLVIVGACLQLWLAENLRDRFKFWSALALLPVLPLTSVAYGGFIGFGTMWAIIIATFLFIRSNRKARYILLAPFVFFAALSLFVNYMAARNDIRRLVWYEQAGVEDRLRRIADVFVNFEWLDLSNPLHRGMIDGRLNQNFLVGVAVERLRSGEVEYASGATFGTLVIGLIPRAIWPDKPKVGGGGSVVHDFTGIDFDESTSVGAGQVLEFYINFGTAGVIGGFLLFGLLIGRMDLSAARYLEEGDQRRFLLWFLICLALLNPGGNLLEIVVGGAASAVAAYGVGHLASRYGHGNSRGAPPLVTRRR
jgi:hypothetical protein